MIDQQLLKIRSYRSEKAERALAVASRALLASQQERVVAEENLKNFIPVCKQQVEALYENIIGKEITLNELEQTRSSELRLHEKQAALEASIGTLKEEIKEKEQHTKEAKQKLILAQKKLNKAEEIVALAQKELQAKEMASENDQLDEFRTKKSLLMAFALLLFLSGEGYTEEKLIYRALDHNLPLLLEDVAARFDLELKAESVPNFRVNREYAFNSMAEFLNKLTRQYKLDWFVYEQVLYIVPRTKRKTRRFTFASARQMEGFYLYLQNKKNKLQSSPFPMVRSARKASITWTAPEIFLRTLATRQELYLNGDSETKAIAAKKHFRLSHHPKKGHGVMIFYLEHAWAGDKEYKFADSVYAVPGIASMVRRLTGAAAASSQGKHKKAPETRASLPTGLEALTALGRKQDKPPSAAAAAPPAAAAAVEKNVGGAVVLADDRLNAVLVYDKREKYKYYKELIGHLDKEAKLVEIEAMIVDVAKDNINELGINWRVTKGKDSGGFGSLGENLGKSALGVSLGAGGLPMALSSNLGGILAKINFLESKGNSRIISRPSVVTMDNLEAVINTTRRFYIKVEGYQDSSLYPIEAGTTLKVTPHVIRNKNKEGKPSIRLFVTIEDGAIEISESATAGSLPTVQENKVKTQAVVEQGESLLIGGHIHTTRSESVTRVPILGQIPLLGSLFSSTNYTERDFIRLFIIRPRVYK